MNRRVFECVEPLLAGLAAYHRHRVHGLEHVPKKGAALIVFNHSLATYDSLLLGYAVYQATGRFVRGLGDRLMFKLPGVRQLATELGIVEGARSNARALLRQGELVMVSPGGMREALRPSSEAFQVDWNGRMGYARLAAEMRVPVILAACPMADRILDVYPSGLTRWAYERFRIPLPLARGIGPTLLPRPVELVHTLSRPQRPPRTKTDAAIERWHRRLLRRMEAMLRVG